MPGTFILSAGAEVTVVTVNKVSKLVWIPNFGIYDLFYPRKIFFILALTLKF